MLVVGGWHEIQRLLCEGNPEDGPQGDQGQEAALK